MKIANLSVVVSLFTTLVALVKCDKHGSGNWLERAFYSDNMDEEGIQSLKPYTAEEVAFNNMMDTPLGLDDADENCFFEIPKKKKSKRDKSRRSTRHKHHNKHKSSKRKSESNRINKRHAKRGMNADEDVFDWDRADNYYCDGKNMHHGHHNQPKHSKHSSHHMINSEMYDPNETFRYEDTKDFYEEELNPHSYSKRGNDSKRNSDESKYLYIPVQTGNEFKPLSDLTDESSEKDVAYLAASNNDKAYESSTSANESNIKDIVNAEDRVLPPALDAEKADDPQKQIIALHSQIQSFMPFFNDLAIISESAVFKRQLEESTVEPPHSSEERAMLDCAEEGTEKDGTKSLVDESVINAASKIFGHYQEQDESVDASLTDNQYSVAEIDKEPEASLLSLVNGELLGSVSPTFEENTNKQNPSPMINELKQDVNQTAATTVTTLENMGSEDAAYLVNDDGIIASINAENKTLVSIGAQKQDELLLLNGTTVTSVSPAYEEKAIDIPIAVEIRSTIASQPEGGIIPLFDRSAFVVISVVPEKKTTAAPIAIEQSTTLAADIKPFDNPKMSGIIAPLSVTAKKPQDETVANVLNETVVVDVEDSSVANASKGAVDNQTANALQSTTMVSILNLFSETVEALAAYTEGNTGVTTMSSLANSENLTKISQPLDSIMSTVKDSENVPLADIVALTKSLNTSDANKPLTPLALIAIKPDKTPETTAASDTDRDDVPKDKSVDFFKRLYSFFFNI